MTDQPSETITAKPAYKRPRGRQSTFSQEIADKVIEGLSKGTPLTVICKEDGMPCDETIRNWAHADPEFALDIARARDAGFDAIALDALRIADNSEQDTVLTDKGGEVPNSEWISRSRLRVETRLKLLAKWDPKRYGDRITTELTGADGGPIKSDMAISADMEAKILHIAERARNIVAPPGLHIEDHDEG